MREGVACYDYDMAEELGWALAVLAKCYRERGGGGEGGLEPVQDRNLDWLTTTIGFPASW